MTQSETKKVLVIAVLYAIGVFLAEISFGNPEFPFHFWSFTKIPTWQWSVPVHLSGLVWMVLWSVILRAKPIIWPIIISIGFFLVCEILNWTNFQFFNYSEKPFGETISFWIVILLYVTLCTITNMMLRWERGRFQSE